MDENNLKLNKQDWLAASLKSFAGAVPFAGSLLQEIINTSIPNQRTDRLIEYCKLLSTKLAELEIDLLKQKMSEDRIQRLIEKSLGYAADSFSTERRKYLAFLVKKCVEKEEITENEQLKILFLLNQLNDIEVIVLKYYSIVGTGTESEFTDRYKSIFSIEVPHIGSEQQTIDRYALYQSYKDSLVRLKLLEPVFDVDSKGVVKNTDKKTGAARIKSYRVNSLGRLILSYIGN